MTENKQKRTHLIFTLAALILVGIVITLIITTKPMPVALLNAYSLKTLWHEGTLMNDCAECHNPVDFHSCETCHDDHGAVELAGIKFFEVIELTGDVPDPSFIRINEIMPDQENMGTHITLFEFLAQNGVESFDSVTFITNDGGLATIEKQYLDETAMLVPYMDGVRFVTESVHSSTWLKGISRIIIVGSNTPLTIDGEQTSIGRLLIQDTVRLTVEGSDTMLIDDTGETSHAYVANWVDGAPLLPLLANQPPQAIIVTDESGNITELQFEEITKAVIAMVRDQVTLVLPDRGRNVWLTNIIKIESLHAND
jgi:hypothetical protein